MSSGVRVWNVEGFTWSFMGSYKREYTGYVAGMSGYLMLPWVYLSFG